MAKSVGKALAPKAVMSKRFKEIAAKADMYLDKYYPKDVPERVLKRRMELNELLASAALNSKMEEVKRLLKAGADVNGMDDSGYTALMCAAKARNREMAEFLLDKGADPNARNTRIYKMTVLMVACERDNREIAKLLLERGADINARDSRNISALSYALHDGQTSMVKFLLERNIRAGSKEDMRKNLEYAVIRKENSKAAKMY
ncbi:MAG: ankyrin repeat domain-containing protein, partial [Candidatus Micrarchaeota archaeon]|nr:ankyrin repeat domain-containing protein [Candidatus Micrarchaeota archaeon]